MIVVRWWSPRIVLKSLYNLALWYDVRSQVERVRALYPKVQINLPRVWKGIVEDALNTLYGDDINHPFEFNPRSRGGARSVAYGLRRRENPRLTDEMMKGGDIFMIAGIARMMGPTKAGIRIIDVLPRWFGKLTKWCQAHMGLTTHQVERDRPRGGRPSRDLADPEPELDLDSETEPDE